MFKSWLNDLIWISMDNNGHYSSYTGIFYTRVINNKSFNK